MAFNVLDFLTCHDILAGCWIRKNLYGVQHICGYEWDIASSIHLRTFMAVVQELIGAGLRIITDWHLLRDCRIRLSFPPRFVSNE